MYCEAPKSSKVVTFQCTFALPLLVDAEHRLRQPGQYGPHREGVPGISALALAGLDLSVDLGCPGRFDAPEFLAAVEKFERAATASKVPRSTAAFTHEQVKSAAARGYSNVMLGFDILMPKNAAATAISWLDS